MDRTVRRRPLLRRRPDLELQRPCRSPAGPFPSWAGAISAPCAPARNSTAGYIGDLGALGLGQPTEPPVPDPIESPEFTEDQALVDENDDLLDPDDEGDEGILPDSQDDPLAFELPPA